MPPRRPYRRHWNLMADLFLLFVILLNGVLIMTLLVVMWPAISRVLDF